jgi:hypothetical protein
MALNLQKGAQTTSFNNSSPDTRVRFVDPRIFFAQAEIAPLNALMEKMKRSVRSTSIKPEWVEKDMGTPTTTLNGAIDNQAATTTVNVAAGTGPMFDVNDILWIPSATGGEQMLVTARTTDALTVVRNWGSAGLAAHADGSQIVKLSSSYAEGATSGVGVKIKPSMPYNVTQIHRTPIELTRSEMQIKRYERGEKGARQDARRDAMILHLEGVERSFINGDLKEDVSTNRRVAKGILRYITTNREDLQGSLTKAKFDSFLKDVMFNGGGKYVLAASGTFMEALHAEVLSKSNMNITPATKEWGLDITRYLSPFGKCDVFYHRVLSQMLEDNYGGCAMLLDMSLVTKYYLQKMILRENIQANDADGFKDEYLEECCAALHNEANHGFIFNV